MRKLTKMLTVMGIAFAGVLVPANKSLAADQNVKIDSKTFPDEAFRKYVTYYDKNEDGILSSEERESVINITAISSKGITSLKGVEYFPELTDIYCDIGNKIEYIDLKKNTKLKALTLSYYGTESIDLSKNTQMTYLNISWENAPETGGWNLSANKELKQLYLKTNVNSINLTKNTKLTELSLLAPVSKIDLSKNTQLEYVYVKSEKLSAINLGNLKKMKQLTIYADEMESINLDNNTELEKMSLYTSKLKQLSLGKNVKLRNLSLNGNTFLETLDLSKNTKLSVLTIQNTQIKELKLNSDELRCVYAYLNSGLQYWDLSHCKKLRDAYNSGEKVSTFKGVEYIKDDIELYLNKTDKVINNVVISTAIIDEDRGGEIKLGKTITGGNVVGAGVYNTGDAVTIKVTTDTKEAYGLEAIYSGEETQDKIEKKKVLTQSGTYQFKAEKDAVFVVVIKNLAPYKMAFSMDSAYCYGKKVKVVLSKMEGYSTYPSVTYQWYRGDKKIEDATKSVYTIQKEDVGKKLSCEMTTANGGKKRIYAEKVIEKGAGKNMDVELKKIAPSREGRADGQIVGVNTSMEYSTSKDFKNKKTCPKSKLTVKAGTYYIRYAETDYRFAGEYVVVKVEDGPSATDVFTDLEKDAWYIDAVKYMYSHGIMNGVSGKKFEPMGQTSRAQFVTMLYNLAGSPQVTKKAGFKDVKTGEWYEQAVNWAYAAKITSGVSETKFGPNDKITRQQAAVMLYKYAAYKKMNTDTNKKALDKFSDKNQVATWAQDAFKWAVYQGVISGKLQGQKTILAPNAEITRAECAQMIKNLMEKVATKK